MGGSRAGAAPLRRISVTKVTAAEKNDDADRRDDHRAYHVEQSAKRRPADHRRLVGRGPGRHRARDQRRRHQQRHQRAAGRHFEGAGAADQEYGAEQQIAVEVMGDEGRGDHQRGQRVEALRRADDGTAVVAVGGVADEQREHHLRHELDQPDQAEVEGAVGDLVDFPADEQRHHLVGHARGHAGEPEQHERPLLRQPGRGRGARRSCSLLSRHSGARTKCANPESIIALLRRIDTGSRDEQSKRRHCVDLLSTLRLSICRASAVKFSGASQRSKAALRAGQSPSSMANQAVSRLRPLTIMCWRKIPS